MSTILIYFMFVPLGSITGDVVIPNQVEIRIIGEDKPKFVMAMVNHKVGAFEIVPKFILKHKPDCCISSL